ncbi:MAG: hypothetical protein KIT36_03380 [Alphaproteobacteria bacterium]|nr:hypothetical protein [Alphaproteobacteria bacterium]
MRRTAGLLALMIAMALAGPVLAQGTGAGPGSSRPCGLSPSDWCPAEPGDRCGRHRDADACKADPACYGQPYRGEAVVACRFDARGFGINCPTVGCTSRRPQRP